MVLEEYRLRKQYFLFYFSIFKLNCKMNKNLDAQIAKANRGGTASQQLYTSSFANTTYI
jgi:hypothetical protein